VNLSYPGAAAARPLRLAFVTSEYGDVGRERGGLGYHLARTVPLLAQRGHACEVFLCDGHSPPSPTAAVAVDEVDGVRVHQLAARPIPLRQRRRLPGQVARHLDSAWTIAEYLALPGPGEMDCLQVPNYGSTGLFVDLPVRQVMRFSSHAPTWHRAAGRPTLRTHLSERIQAEAIRRVDHHFAPSQFVASLASADYGIPVAVIRPPQLSAGEYRADGVDAVARHRPLLLHAGQLGPAKGTDLLVAALDLLLSEGAEVDALFCGRDAGSGAAVQALQSRYPDRVSLSPALPQSELHRQMTRALAVVCPSRVDNLPNVAIEAMSLGVPVVGLRTGSVDELVMDGEGGLLAQGASPAELAQALQRLIALDTRGRVEMGARARSRIESVLGEAAALRALEAFYRESQRGALRSVPPRWTLLRELEQGMDGWMHEWVLSRGPRGPWRTLRAKVRQTAERLGFG
jgi:glycosyltransferase involved in cell wall biosynthesis